MPDALTERRGLDAFEQAVPKLTKTVWVGLLEKDPAGFVAWEGSEITFLFLIQAARGTGLAAALMQHAEACLAEQGFTEAGLDYVKGNARAARFYAREGWRILREERESIEIDGHQSEPWVSVICSKRLGSVPPTGGSGASAPVAHR